MKKLSTLLIALCLIVTLAVSVSAANILGTQTKLVDEENGVYDWDSEEHPLIIHRTGPADDYLEWSYFNGEKAGAKIKMSSGMMTYLSMNVQSLDAVGTQYKLDLTEGFAVTVEDIEWDANSNAAIAITIGNANRANNMDNGALTLVVRKDGTVVLYNNYSGNWYGETASHYNDEAISANATSFTYSMKKIEGGYKYYVNDVLLATFDASNADAWPADLVESVDALGFNFLGINGDLDQNGDAVLNGNLTYSVVAIDDMSDPDPDPDPDPDEDVPPMGDHIGAVVLLAAVAGGAALAFTKKKAK